MLAKLQPKKQVPIKKETVAKTSKNPEIKDRLAEFRAILYYI